MQLCNRAEAIESLAQRAIDSVAIDGHLSFAGGGFVLSVVVLTKSVKPAAKVTH